MGAEIATFEISIFKAKWSEHSLAEQLPGMVSDYLGRSLSVFEDRVEFDVYKTGHPSGSSPSRGLA